MIYLLRHGLDDEDYIGGWSNVDLTKEGIKQVKKSRNFIVSSGLQINRIISSDIQRAVHTADIINEELNLKITYDTGLRELDKGDYTGVKKCDLSKEELERIKQFGINDRYPNGESMNEFYERMKVYFEKLIEYDNALLVTHRGVINMFYYLLNDIKLSMNKERFGVVHASIHELDINEKLIRRIY